MSDVEVDSLSTAETADFGVALVVEAYKLRGGLTTRDTTIRGRNRLVAQTPDGRRLSLFVKTRRRGDWQTDTRFGQSRTPALGEKSFWVLVDLTEHSPAFFIVPEGWMENDIHANHQAYLRRHGGRRARNPSATHHRITTDRVERWRERWDLLGVSGGSNPD